MKQLSCRKLSCYANLLSDVQSDCLNHGHKIGSVLGKIQSDVGCSIRSCLAGMTKTRAKGQEGKGVLNIET